MPALPVLTDDRRRNTNLTSPIELDFGAVRDVSSTGLTVFLLQFTRLNRSSRSIKVGHHAPHPIRERLEDLGAFRNLSIADQPDQTELFSMDTSLKGLPISHPHVRSIPIFNLEFPEGGDRREVVRAFLSFLKHAIRNLAGATPLQANGLIMLLNEIAKNTADHAGADALFGMDVFTLPDGSHRISFAYGDHGVGIKQHIEHNLPPEDEKRRRHMSLYEAYRLALKPGYTSNRITDVNKGHGMSIIIECASTLGMHLSVFDAWSRGMLTSLPDLQGPTHAALRRVFRTVGHDVGFFYFGEMSLPAV